MPRVFRPQVLHHAFIGATEQTKQKVREIPHNVKVARLYRASLKTLLSWTVDRDVFNEEADKLRARFDANRGVSAAAANRLLNEGDDEHYLIQHPDRYVPAYMPGGSLYMRNPPVPLEVCFPDGNYPADAPTVTVNPDMTICKPETGKVAVGSVLVDFAKKTME